MSGTHSHTAAAQADVQRADVQDRKPNIPPGHVEADRPVRRIDFGRPGSIAAIALVVVGVIIALAFLVG